MNHLTDIVNALNAHDLSQAVLATVVQVDGSAYRQPGARMLILADGRHVGMVSGGCLEKHLVQRAFWLTRDGACVQTYHTAETENSLENSSNLDNLNLSGNAKNPIEVDITQRLLDEQAGFGLGCNGTIKVLFEQVDSQFCQNLIRVLRQMEQNKQPQIVATVINSDCQHIPLGWHGTPLELEQLLATVSQLHTPHPTWQKIQIPASRKSPFIIECYQMVHDGKNYYFEVLIETLQPPLHLLIFGAGQDSVPLVTMAKLQGWQVSVIDSRADYIRHIKARFNPINASNHPPLSPDHLECLQLSQANSIATQLTAYPKTAVAIMTHSVTQDNIWLTQALQSLLKSGLESPQNPPFYIGQLGPRYRTEKLLLEIAQTSPELQNLVSSDIIKKTLFYPMGLDLGGDTPEAVALSIIAQIQAVYHQTLLAPYSLAKV